MKNKSGFTGNEVSVLIFIIALITTSIILTFIKWHANPNNKSSNSQFSIQDANHNNEGGYSIVSLDG
jgi:hypothetical protein